MSRVVGFAVAVALIAIAQSAAAQDRVYRCGAEGRSYSQQPCLSGTPIEVADTRSMPQVAQAQRVAQIDARLADALARQRQQAESAAARQGPVLIGYSGRVAPAASACRMDSRCASTDGSKRGKSDRVTLYRAPAHQ